MSKNENESDIIDGEVVESDTPEDESPPTEQRSWWWPAVAALTAILLFVFAICVLVRSDNRSSPSTQDTGPTAVAQNTACDGFTVQLDPNYSNNIFSQGLSPNAEKMRQEVAQGTKQDPRIFQVYYNASPLGKANPINDVTEIAPLKNGSCFTPDGVDAYNKWIVLWDVAKLTFDNLPASGVNTGAVANGQAFTQNGAIPAGTGVRVTYYDAASNTIGEHWVRLECGNVVTPGTPIPSVPSIPPGTTPPTTETTLPPPPTTETTPPTTETTPPPPTTETTPAPKDPSLDPYPRGNAPQGGGPNDQPGPGPSNIPTQPPSTPRTNPPRPVATSAPGTPAPTQVSTPVTAPPPEPGVNGNGTGTTTVPHTDESGGVTTSVVQTATVPKPQ